MSSIISTVAVDSDGGMRVNSVPLIRAGGVNAGERDPVNDGDKSHCDVATHLALDSSGRRGCC